MPEKKYQKAQIKQSKQKELFIEQLKKTPIVQLVCEKLEVGRTSYYRWYKQDEKFAEEVDKSLSEGKYLVNDMAESVIINAIKDRNLSATFFWLKHHHGSYANRVELTTKNGDLTLTDEQKEIIRNSLSLASFTRKEVSDGNEKAIQSEPTDQQEADRKDH